MDGDLSINLRYESTPPVASRGGRNQGPGWYLSAIRSGEQEWLIGPFRVSNLVALDIAESIDRIAPSGLASWDSGGTRRLVRAQNNEAIRRLRERVSGLTKVKAELEQAERLLAEAER